MIDGVATAIDTATVNAAGGWTATRTDLPAYRNGKTISYYWRQGSVPDGYTFVINSDVGNTANGFQTTIWNMLTPAGVIPPAGGVVPVPGVNLITIEDLETPLGLGNVFNNIGDCFE